MTNDLPKETVERIKKDAENKYPATFERDGVRFDATYFELQRTAYQSGAKREALRSLSIEAERDELKAWKESAISVTPDMQAIGKALNVKLGESIHDKILPGINNLLKERDRYKEVLRMDEAYSLTYVLEKLSHAAEILLHKKDYDGSDYEEMEFSIAASKEILKAINPETTK